MPKLDNIIAEVNGDLQDCLSAVRDRFRQAMSEIFDYAVTNPASTAAQAQTAIGTAFRVHYPDGLVSPGITIEQALTAFNNRHGVGATAALKWESVRNFIVARSSWKSRVTEWLEEGSLPSVPSLKLDSINGRLPNPVGAADKTVMDARDASGKLLTRTWESVSLGYRVRENVQTGTVEEA